MILNCYFVQITVDGNQVCWKIFHLKSSDHLLSAEVYERIELVRNSSTEVDTFKLLQFQKNIA